MSASISAEMRGRPGYERRLEPSNFCATSRRYQARMVAAWPRRPPRPDTSGRGACRFRRAWIDAHPRAGAEWEAESVESDSQQEVFTLEKQALVHHARDVGQQAHPFVVLHDGTNMITARSR